MTSRAALPSWQALQQHAVDMKSQHMKDLFSKDANRFNEFSLNSGLS